MFRKSPEFRKTPAFFSAINKEIAKCKELWEKNDYTLLLQGADLVIAKMKLVYPRIKNVVRQCAELQEYHNFLVDEVKVLEKTRDKLYDEIARYQQAKGEQLKVAYFSKKEENEVRTEIRRKQELLVKEKEKVTELQNELIIKQEELQEAIQDTNLAKKSFYHLSEAEIELFNKEREKILKGVEQYGSISLAVQKDKSISMRVSSIMHYAAKHKQFGEDLEIAKKVFKDSLDAEMVDRALNGTMNPVFQKGEYIGDYAVKDNKLLIEVAKAKLPETYNPRAYAAANPQGPVGTTINILSFDGVDETKRGYAKNIGVVKSVDESGRVERITQNKKMIDYYKDKPGAEIIEAEVVKDGPSTSEEK